MTESNNLEVLRSRFNMGLDISDIFSRNREAFQAILCTLAIDNKTEVPLDTVLSMYSLFDDMKHAMCKDELEFRYTVLEQSGFICIREGIYGTKMVSFTESANKRYSA
jgi:hypothetical protein